MPRFALFGSSFAPPSPCASVAPTEQDDNLYDAELNDDIHAAVAIRDERRVRLKGMLTAVIAADKAQRGECLALVRRCASARNAALTNARDTLAMDAHVEPMTPAASEAPAAASWPSMQ